MIFSMPCSAGFPARESVTMEMVGGESAAAALTPIARIKSEANDALDINQNWLDSVIQIHRASNQSRCRARARRTHHIHGPLVKELGTPIYSDWCWFWAAKCENTTGLIGYLAGAVAGIAIQKK